MGANNTPAPAKSFFFQNNCFRSHLFNPAYPDTWLDKMGALYNPIIDAVFLPTREYSETSKIEQEQIIYTNYHFEIGHRLLNSTTIMCQIRMFASLIYDSYCRTTLSHLPEFAKTTEKRFLAGIHSLETILNMLMFEATHLQEAYSLLYGIGTLKTPLGRFDTNYADAEKLEKICLDSLDKPTRGVYAALRRLEDRLGTGSPKTLGIIGSLNIPWVPIFSPDTWANRPINDPLDLVELVNKFFHNRLNRPIWRFKYFLDVIDHLPIVGLSTLSEEDFNEVIWNSCPTLHSYFTHPCDDSNCICKNLLESLPDYSSIPTAINPAMAVMKLSRLYKSEIDETIHDEAIHVARDIDEDTWREIYTSILGVPSLIFYDNQCFVKPDGPIVTDFALVCIYESIRQQISVLNQDSHIPLQSPWDLISSWFMDDNTCPVFKRDSKFVQQLMSRLWDNTRSFRFAKKWHRPNCYTDMDE